MTHYMHLADEPFIKIKEGKKNIELRLFDEKRALISPGDEIVFSCRNSDEMVSARVTNLHIFDSFRELYMVLPLIKCGYDPAEVGNATYTDMDKYYSAEQQEKYGVVGIEFDLI